MLIGRPTEYSEEISSKSREYINSCVDEVENYHKTRGDKSNSYERIIKVNLPTIEGLARHLGVARSTVYKWKEEHPDFSYILEELLERQAEVLINRGLSGDYNSTIAKLLLTKHGYKEEKTTDLKIDRPVISGFNFIRNDDTNTKSDIVFNTALNN